MLALLLLAACATSSAIPVSTCSLGTPTLAPTAAAPGETVVLTASPLTESWDTAITVGASRAEVLVVDRSTCEDCDDCRDTGGCAACGTCDSCEETCTTCVETVSFVVPALAAGSWPVELVNGHGRSERVALEVLAVDTAPADTAPADTAP